MGLYNCVASEVTVAVLAVGVNSISSSPGHSNHRITRIAAAVDGSRAWAPRALARMSRVGRAKVSISIPLGKEDRQNVRVGRRCWHDKSIEGRLRALEVESSVILKKLCRDRVLARLKHAGQNVRDLAVQRMFDEALVIHSSSLQKVDLCQLDLIHLGRIAIHRVLAVPSCFSSSVTVGWYSIWWSP